MSILIRKLQLEWPAWLAVAFVALLPVHRLSEAPLLVFAVLTPFLWRSPDHAARTREVAAFILPLFACFWIPMLLSSVDSYLPQKSWVQSIAALRFPLAAIGMAVLLANDSLRWKVLKWSACILLFWAVDGFVQLLPFVIPVMVIFTVWAIAKRLTGTKKSAR